MNNTISTRQNLPENLYKLASQRCLYSKAKLVSGIRLTLIVPVIVLITLVSMALNSDLITNLLNIGKVDYSWLVTASGIIIALIDLLVLSPMIKKIQEKAAKIQELFDCNVFGLPWNQITVGDKPSYELISKYSSKTVQDTSRVQQLKDWYSDLSPELPHYVQILICQRSSLVWDHDLRQGFSNFNLYLGLFLFLFLLSTGLYIGIDLKGFFMLVLAPILPIILYATRQYHDNKDSMQELNDLQRMVSDEWEHILNNQSNSELHFLRSIQDKIYDGRKRNPLIFDWYYNFHKDRQHQDMYYSIEQLVSDYKSTR